MPVVYVVVTAGFGFDSVNDIRTYPATSCTYVILVDTPPIQLSAVLTIGRQYGLVLLLFCEYSIESNCALTVNGIGSASPPILLHSCIGTALKTLGISGAGPAGAGAADNMSCVLLLTIRFLLQQAYLNKTER
jgi:hypothetical protein